MPRLALLWVFALSLSQLVTGCSKDPAEDAGVSDANGYLCQKCNLKFYTLGSAFAEVCPTCKVASILPVVGYVCTKDGTTMIMPKSQQAVLCEKCQSHVTAIKLPREKDLQAWGAAKKSKAEVSQK